MNRNPGNAIAGAIKTVYGRQDVFAEALNKELEKMGSKQKFTPSVISNWCQLNDEVLTAINNTLGCNIRKFFS